ncbi:MAG: ATP-binding protein [Chromatiales bacterium]|nr:ATP-binding protein [Chromatiales bacterium]
MTELRRLALIWSDAREDRTSPWRPLRLFNLYRMIIAGFLLVTILSGAGPSVLGRLSPALFTWVTGTYLATSLALSLASRFHWPGFRVQVLMQATADIVAIALLVYASGGVTSGLGMLMIAAVAGLSLVSPGRLALLYAAAGSLALLGVQGAGLALDTIQDTAFTHTGLLGIALFATASLAVVLARRVHESEDLAMRRGIDLANMAELNAHIIARMQSGVIAVDDHARILLINEAAWRLLGNPAASDPNALGQIHPQLHQAFLDWHRDPQRHAKTILELEEDATELQVRFTPLGTGERGGSLIFLDDTAELRRQMQEVKLASLGRLTASIAHEIRNPLGAISHASQLLGESDELSQQDRRLSRIIDDQCRRMNAVIQSILSLSRKEAPRQQDIDLKPWLLHFAEEFAHHQSLGMQRLDLHIPDEIRVRFDPDHLHQVLWNLCVNALKYGQPVGEGPLIDIQVGDRQVGRSVSLDVIDRGKGVDPAIKRRLFEPFVTGSDDGSGTGLGLYIARELCENNGGRLDYIPLPTGGSCFRIQFPARDAGTEPRLAQPGLIEHREFP